LGLHLSSHVYIERKIEKADGNRTITLVVAIATLTSNTLSSLLFAQLPDDPFHLASNFGWYLHFANVLSVFGFIGALRQHALSIAIFANYLIIDTILCSIPRFLLLGLLNTFSSTLCSPSLPSTPSSTTSIPQQQPQLTLPNTQTTPEESCMDLLNLAQLTLLAGLIAATVLQFVGALCVREYAKALWVREWARDDVEVVEVDVQEVMQRGLRNEERMQLLSEERRRREMLIEEWGFGGLPAIVEGDEKV